MNEVRVRSPEGDMYRLVGEWSGETMGQDFNGRGRILAWLEPVGPMSRVEREEPMDRDGAIMAIARNREAALEQAGNELGLNTDKLPALPPGEGD